MKCSCGVMGGHLSSTLHSNSHSQATAMDCCRCYLPARLEGLLMVLQPPLKSSLAKNGLFFLAEELVAPE